MRFFNFISKILKETVQQSQDYHNQDWYFVSEILRVGKFRGNRINLKCESYQEKYRENISLHFEILFGSLLSLSPKINQCNNRNAYYSVVIQDVEELVAFLVYQAYERDNYLDSDEKIDPSSAMIFCCSIYSHSLFFGCSSI